MALLDEDSSDVDRFDTGRIMRLRRPIFRAERTQCTMAFKLAEMPRADLLVTPELAGAITATGLATGTRFVPAS